MKGSSSRGLVGVQRGTEVSDTRKGAATTLVFKVRNRMSSGARPRPGLFSSTAILSWRLSKIIGRPTNGTIGGVDIDKWGWAWRAVAVAARAWRAFGTRKNHAGARERW